MILTLEPLAVFLGVVGAVGLCLFAFWERIVTFLGRWTEPYRAGLERAAIPIKSEELVIGILGVAVVPWGIVMFLMRPEPVPGALILLAFLLVAFYGCRGWINMKIANRLTAFNAQLELSLRLIAGALRVGMGLRQALVMVVTDMPDPARVEFTRVLSQTTIGVSIYDALDQLSLRMPSSELTMMTRAIRVQSQTGGNLGKVLENLAETIKQRRRIARKVRALTSEATASKYIITALPVAVGGFIVGFEPDMRDGLFYTPVGHICLMIVAGLLGTGWWLFGRISRFDV
ncbi:MAG TPA: type II secretion system F family protein [Candidatus Dormibacteraeota bacterium]|nr:type II secretion system F family protein [Candidatus Dormibacteraeota bacterium]